MTLFHLDFQEYMDLKKRKENYTKLQPTHDREYAHMRNEARRITY